ncbi:MAG: hypothetical protein Q9222_005003 [Ikaeria aurantiellina]
MIAIFQANTPPSTQQLNDQPYKNYFYSDCNVATQVVVTSPEPDSNLSIVGPRLIVAWPAGNSGVCAFFAPQSGINGSLAIGLLNSSDYGALQPYYNDAGGQYPKVGVGGVIRFNASAELTVPILGSVRTVRDFTEGPSLLALTIQDAIKYHSLADGGKLISRVWFDNVTNSELGFIPLTSNTSTVEIHTNEIGNTTLRFQEGDYIFYSSINYPQLTQLNASAVLNEASQDLINQDPDQTTSLSFLSYSEKLLAGAWRFLTYFGRDSMIATLLLQPVLSDSAIEAVIGAVIERINRTDGSVCHEETIGDYATYLNMQDNLTSTDPIYDYKMIDTDYYLPILMDRYFLQTSNGSGRARSFLKTPAGSINPANRNLTYSDLLTINAEKIMETASRFAAEGNQTIENLARLKEGQLVGQWRDSTYGTSFPFPPFENPLVESRRRQHQIVPSNLTPNHPGIGGGRIPLDVNAALLPAALSAISHLSSSSLFPTHPSWSTLASQYAQIWSSRTLPFFASTIPAPLARQRVANYSSTYLSNNTAASAVDSIDDDIHLYSLALGGNNNLSHIEVMNADPCFRLFLLNSSSSDQDTRLINATALSILRRFPAGLLTDVGLLVSNPAYGGQEVYARNWTRAAYHGTVVWSWVMGMMAQGLETQLLFCETSEGKGRGWCGDEVVYENVRGAYNGLWDVVEGNRGELSSEVWSWSFVEGEGEGRFGFEAFGSLPPPEGESPTESDVRQLWSLTFLAVRRNEGLK